MNKPLTERQVPHDSTYIIPRIVKKQKERWLSGAGETGERDLLFNGHVISTWDDEKVLELVV